MNENMSNTQRNLKNIQQIGSTDEEDRIYIEKSAYDRIHQEEFAEKRVFVLMGYTEFTDDAYTTFIQAAIPVRDIEFVQNIPRWNNRLWNGVFQEIKRAYSEDIIVGWAVDMKGMPPKISMEFEAVHKEQFGGEHQILFLLDTAENEEYFYVNRKNHYEPVNTRAVKVEVELPRREEDTIPDWKTIAASNSDRAKIRPKYRDMIKTQEKRGRARPSFSSYAMTAAIVMLVGVIGAGAYRTRNQMQDLKQAITTMSVHGESTEKVDKENDKNSEVTEDTQTQKDTQNTGDDSVNSESIPMDVIPGIENQDQTSDAALAKAGTQSETYIVKKGDTLLSICRAKYADNTKLQKICELNGISDPDEIYDGQVLKMPE